VACHVIIKLESNSRLNLKMTPTRSRIKIIIISALCRGCSCQTTDGLHRVRWGVSVCSEAGTSIAKRRSFGPFQVACVFGVVRPAIAALPIWRTHRPRRWTINLSQPICGVRRSAHRCKTNRVQQHSISRFPLAGASEREGNQEIEPTGL
jgi:hypothetical protein